VAVACVRASAETRDHSWPDLFPAEETMFESTKVNQSLSLVDAKGSMQVMFGGGVSSLHSGIESGRVGPVRGLLGGGRRGWCEQWARSC
jgi:hypothetical protein